MLVSDSIQNKLCKPNEKIGKKKKNYNCAKFQNIQKFKTLKKQRPNYVNLLSTETKKQIYENMQLLR